MESLFVLPKRSARTAESLASTCPVRWSMLHDGLAQGLLALDWRRILVLRGPQPPDQMLSASFLGSAKKFGLRIAEARDFVAGNDPRKRDQINVRLLTGGVDYDAVRVSNQKIVYASLSGYGQDGPYGNFVGHDINPLTKVVDRMVSANLVYRRADDADRRRVMVFASDRGQQALQRWTAAVEREQDDLEAAIGREEIALLRALLTRVSGRLI